MTGRDLLREEYIIDTPENVTFGYEVAGIGSRFIGALVDTLLILAALFVLNLLLGVALGLSSDGGNAQVVAGGDDPGWVAGLVIAIYGLLNFTVVWGYYLAFELGWNGQTPGKRVAGTQVVKADGSPAGFSEAAIRNLVRIVDFLPMAYAVGVITMFCNRQTRRLGDFAAGTLVIKQHSAVKLAQLGTRPPRASSPAQPAADPAESVLLQFPNMRRLSAADYQVVRDALARHDQGALSPEMLFRLAAAIAGRLQVPAPDDDWTQTRRFLSEVAEAYRVLGER